MNNKAQQKEKNDKFKFNFLLLIIIVLILIMLNIILILNKFLFPKRQEKYNQAENILTTNNSKGGANTTQNQASETSEEAVIKKLKAGTERDRMEYYAGQYISYLEYGEYEKAYNLLYDKFKQNYFPTLEKFQEYAKKTYPQVIGVKYEDIDRQGNIYVLTVNINDPINGTQSKTQRLVIQENDYNNYVLSFQVQ